MEEKEENESAVSPPALEEADGLGDTELLKAISEHPECARVLAEIARGGDPGELLKSLTCDKDAPEVPMFRSATTPVQQTQAEVCPYFLSEIRPDFWDF